ncbi:hypothetical protein DWF00_14770 [Bosea caraganae]|uniref:Uncharacterized protein n=2 Tax=Bosea caraganae TaxID=2763117 RepID=A0A370KYJ8_9HYPH|nr:hypothetical protein DWE98_26655 [Bosea caraganae]RDJ25667.1 hypothetical protein DWF00_14770 [Bosea caraganae]
MRPQNPRQQMTQGNATFHDAAAKDAYASRFRPIAFPAIAAGTRRAPAEEQNAEKKPENIPAILRNGFDD